MPKMSEKTDHLKCLIQCFHSPHNFHPEFKAYRQLLIAPFIDDLDSDLITLRRAQTVDFNLSEVLHSVEGLGKDALFQVSLESGSTYFPTNITSFKGKSVAIICDTHHGHYPITKIVDYLTSPHNSYDYTYISPCAQPAHILHFYWAGVDNIDIYPRSLTFLRRIRHHAARKHGVAYVGNAHSPWHPRRSRIVSTLKRVLPELGIPFLMYPPMPQDDWPSLLAEHEITIYSSLNAQPSQQLHANIASGTLCLADKLSASTGVESLYHPGIHYDTYSSVDNLIDKIDYYFSHQKKAKFIGEMGQIQAARINLFEEDPLALAELAIESSRRTPLQQRHPAFKLRSPNASLFRSQLEIYEFIQEMHRIYELVQVLVIDNTTDLLHFVFSLENLSRLNVSLLSGSVKTLDTASIMLMSAFRSFELKLSSDLDPKRIANADEFELTIVILGNIEESTVLDFLGELDHHTVFIFSSPDLLIRSSIAGSVVNQLTLADSTQEVVSTVNRWRQRTCFWKKYGLGFRDLPVHVNENLPTQYPVFLSRP